MMPMLELCLINVGTQALLLLCQVHLWQV